MKYTWWNLGKVGIERYRAVVPKLTGFGPLVRFFHKVSNQYQFNNQDFILW